MLCSKKAISKVHDTKDTIKSILNTQEITYTVDIFCDTLKLPVESPNNPFIAPVNIKVIESFMRNVGYQCVVAKVGAFCTKFLAQPWQTIFKKKDVIQYPRFIKLIIDDLIKKFPSIPQRLDEDYHSIKDDIPLVSFYSTRNVLFRGMPIPDALLTNEIRATIDYTEYEMVFVKVAVLMNQLQLEKKRKQSARETSSPRKSLKVTIKQKAKTTSIPPPSNDREMDEISEVTLLSLTLHKIALTTNVEKKLVEEEIENKVEGNPKVVDDDVTKKKDDKKNEDEEKDDDVEKMDDVVEKKDNDDHNNNTWRHDQIRNHIKNNFLIHEFVMGKIQEVLDHCNNVVPELTFAKTNEMIKDKMLRLHNSLPLSQPPLTPATTAGTTTTAAVVFPAAVAAVAGCGRQNGRHRRGGAYTTSDLALTFPCMGLSAAKPPSGRRPDDGTATTAAPCGVGLVVHHSLPLSQPPLTPATTAGTTTTAAVVFPAAAAVVAGCGRQNGRHRRGGAYTTSDPALTFPCMVVTSTVLRNI
nr:hypothetical protein [Tanacetum cinerariifolium]